MKNQATEQQCNVLPFFHLGWEKVNIRISIHAQKSFGRIEKKQNRGYLLLEAGETDG